MRARWQALPMIVARSLSLYLWISTRLSLFFFYLYLSLFLYSDWFAAIQFFFFRSLYGCIYVRSLFFFSFIFFSLLHCPSFLRIFSSFYVHLLFVFFSFHHNTFTLDSVEDDNHHYHQHFVGRYRNDLVYWTNE
jgi:hypothetical protein